MDESIGENRGKICLNSEKAYLIFGAIVEHVGTLEKERLEAETEEEVKSLTNRISQCNNVLAEISRTRKCPSSGSPARRVKDLTPEEGDAWRAEQDRTERERMRKLGRTPY